MCGRLGKGRSHLAFQILRIASLRCAYQISAFSQLSAMIKDKLNLKHTNRRISPYPRIKRRQRTEFEIRIFGHVSVTEPLKHELAYYCLLRKGLHLMEC